MSITNVLLLGASGITGTPILHALHRSSRFNISIATRSGSTFTIDEDIRKSVKMQIVDYNSPTSLTAAFQGQDAIVSALTTFAVPLQYSIIDAAITAGVKRFMPSEFGIDTANPAAEEVIPATKMKRDILAYLCQKQDLNQAGNLTWTAIFVGAYFDWALETGFFGYDFTNHTAQVCGDENTYFEATNLDRIGEAVVKCLEKTEETENQYVYVHSFRVTQAQVFDAISAVTKGQLWRKEFQNSKEMWEDGLRISSATELDQGLAMVIRTVLMGYRADLKLNDFGDKATYWAKKLGFEDEDLAIACEKIVTGLVE